MEIFIGLMVCGALWWWLSQPSSSSSSAPRRGDAPEPKEAGATGTPARTAEQRQAAHLASALAFTQARKATLEAQQQADVRWQQKFGQSAMAQIDGLSGVDFEHYLAGLLRARGYAVETTATSGDFGADLILTRNGERTAVQAKRWKERVGVAAVQEAISGRAYYRCQHGWVITTSGFTAQAIALAASAEITLIDRAALATMIGERSAQQG